MFLFIFNGPRQERDVTLLINISSFHQTDSAHTHTLKTVQFIQKGTDITARRPVRQGLMVSHVKTLCLKVKTLEKRHLWLLSMLLCEEADSSISARGEDPGLRGVKGHIQNTKIMSHHMTSEDFHWDDEWILQKVTVEVGRRG